MDVGRSLRSSTDTISQRGLHVHAIYLRTTSLLVLAGAAPVAVRARPAGCRRPALGTCCTQLVTLRRITLHRLRAVQIARCAGPQWTDASSVARPGAAAVGARLRSAKRPRQAHTAGCRQRRWLRPRGTRSTRAASIGGTSAIGTTCACASACAKGESGQAARQGIGRRRRCAGASRA